jgi:hypothetical protein
MRFTPFGDIELTYLAMDFVDYGVGGQYYGLMEGSLRSDRLSGRLRLTNTAHKRTDNVNTPTLTGVLTTDDGATVVVEMNGLSQIQEGGRVFITSLTFRTAQPEYEWVNTLFGVVEGELHGRPRPNEMHARCRVYACEATIKPSSEGGDRSMSVMARAWPVSTGRYAEIRAAARELDSGSAELKETDTAREAAFLQHGPEGGLLLVYGELDGGAPTAKHESDGTLEERLGNRVAAISGPGPSAGAPRVELLVHQRASRRGPVLMAAYPLIARKSAQLHEFAIELNGIHVVEFEDSLARLEVGLALFIQHMPTGDLVITVVEGDDPEDAFRRLAESTHEFDRWFVKEFAALTAADIASPPPIERLWSWEPARVGAK